MTNVVDFSAAKASRPVRLTVQRSFADDLAAWTSVIEDRGAAHLSRRVAAIARHIGKAWEAAGTGTAEVDPEVIRDETGASSWEIYDAIVVLEAKNLLDLVGRQARRGKMPIYALTMIPQVEQRPRRA